MILSAVIILDHFLFDEPQILNFGGKNFYSFTVDNIEKKISVSFIENENYISNFWNSTIQNISAIVGSNGSGKTSLLKSINKSFQDNTHAVFIYENIKEDLDLQIFINNRTGDFDADQKKNQGTEFQIFINGGKDFSNYVNESVISLYYSSSYDPIIPNFYSLLSLEAETITKNLSVIYSESLMKQIKFLNNQISKSIKANFDDFPTYNFFEVLVKAKSKRTFTQVYSDTNIGNPEKIETLKIHIESDLNAQDFSNPSKLLKRYLSIISTDNLFDALKQIWDLPQYINSTVEKSHLIIDSANLLKNFEITILSYLTLNDTFLITGNNGHFDFRQILNSSNFEAFLDNFLKKYIISQDIFFEDHIDYITLKNSKGLIDLISITYKRMSHIGGVSTSMLKEKMLKDIQGLNDISLLYNYIQELLNDRDKDVLTFSVDNKRNVEQAEAFFLKYSKVVQYFSNIPGINPDFMEVKTDVNLSFGEKCLLNLYATIFGFTKSNDSSRKRENYILILDEADLGYHPMWKKKFVDTINKTLPIIFSELTPMIYRANNWEKNPDIQVPNLQVIFTTHDPLSLSDMPNKNVIYLKRSECVTEVLEIDDIVRPSKTFGANITDLLADSFFISDGLIGDFSKGKIEEIIKWINSNKKIKKRNFNKFSKELIYYKNVIKLIDEPIVKIKLSEMISELENSSEFHKNTLDDEIRFLTERRNNLS